jgi:hypothetical protein
MKKTLLLVATLAACAIAGAQNLPAPTATTYFGENQTRTLVNAQTNVNVSGDGSALSSVSVDSAVHANGAVAVLPGAIGITGDVGGSMKVVAYTRAEGPGVINAQALGGSWNDAAWNANAALVTPNGAAALDVKMDGGMANAQRYGVDAHVDAGKNQDGVAVGQYDATVSALTTMSQTPIPGGAQLATSTVVATTNDSSAAVGGVTFEGGVPAGQTAAPRWAQAGVDVVVQTMADDPLHP